MNNTQTLVVDNNAAVVLDLGSRQTRAGLASAVFPEPNGPRICVETAVAEDTPAGGRHTRRPIHRGCIEDMDGVEAVLKEVLYNQVGWASKISEKKTTTLHPAPSHQRSVLLVEPSMQPRATREKLMQLLFEEFRVENYFSMDAAVASLYAIGKTSGIVVDVGYEKVDVTPVLEGVVHASCAVRHGGFGGHVMTEMIAQKHGLGYAEAEAKKRAGDDSVGATLEAMCGEEIAGRISDIGSACIHASMVSLVPGEREWRKALMEQVFVCGGGARVAGFGARVLADVVQKHSSGFKPGILSVPEYMPGDLAIGCASWYGGHATAGVVMNPAVIQKQCVTRALYEEHGPRALWRRQT